MANSGQLEFALKLHDNLSDWTARVDGKASIALAIEAAVLGFVVTLATGSGPLASASGGLGSLLVCGLAALGASVAMAILVVFPQLRRFHLRDEYRANYVYFGHLRLWSADDLEKRLETHSDDLAVVSRQLVRMSEIVWRKHVWLQWSFVLLIVGIALEATVLCVTLLGTKP